MANFHVDINKEMEKEVCFYKGRQWTEETLYELPSEELLEVREELLKELGVDTPTPLDQMSCVWDVMGLMRERRNNVYGNSSSLCRFESGETTVWFAWEYNNEHYNYYWFGEVDGNPVDGTVRHKLPGELMNDARRYQACLNREPEHWVWGTTIEYAIRNLLEGN